MGKLKDVFRKLKKRPFCSAVILAAGASERAGKDKIFSELCGRPTLVHTLLAFERSDCIGEIILVVRQDKIETAAQLCDRYKIGKVKKIVCGGATRMQSSLNGVSEVSARTKLVAIHDGARPLVTETLIEEVVHNAYLYKAAAPAVPVKDTIKRVKGNFMVRTLSRDETVAVQTPQVFRTDLIKGALTDAVARDFPLTDDCSAAELFGVKTRVVPGSEENMKLTTPIDFAIAKSILESRHEA